MEKHFCDKCEIEINNQMTKLIFEKKEKDYEIGISNLKREFCSLGCLEKWINKERRSVSSITDRSTGLITYFNDELRAYVHCFEVQKESEKFCIKPEIWEKLTKS